jgi:hypothetical protein
MCVFAENGCDGLVVKESYLSLLVDSRFAKGRVCGPLTSNSITSSRLRPAPQPLPHPMCLSNADHILRRRLHCRRRHLCHHRAGRAFGRPGGRRLVRARRALLPLLGVRLRRVRGARARLGLRLHVHLCVRRRTRSLVCRLESDTRVRVWVPRTHPRSRFGWNHICPKYHWNPKYVFLSSFQTHPQIHTCIAMHAFTNHISDTRFRPRRSRVVSRPT